MSFSILSFIISIPYFNTLPMLVRRDIDGKSTEKGIDIFFFGGAKPNVSNIGTVSNNSL